MEGLWNLLGKLEELPDHKKCVPDGIRDPSALLNNIKVGAHHLTEESHCTRLFCCLLIFVIFHLIWSGCIEAVCSGWPWTVLHWRAHCQVAWKGELKLAFLSPYCCKHMLFSRGEILGLLRTMSAAQHKFVAANSRLSRFPSRHGTNRPQFLRPSCTVLAWGRPCTSPTVRSARKAPPSLRYGADGCGVNAAPAAAGRSAATASTATTWGSSAGQGAWRKAASWDSVWRWVLNHGCCLYKKPCAADLWPWSNLKGFQLQSYLRL